MLPRHNSFPRWMLIQSSVIHCTLIAIIIGFFTSECTAQNTLPDRSEDFHLFLLAGQSNMAGRGEIDPEQDPSNPRILSLDANGEWVTAMEPLHFDKPKMVGVGLGKTFALDYAAENPDVTVGLIPCAVGGSPIKSWTPGGIHDQTNSHPLDDTLRRVQIASRSGKLKGILWHQGESDSNQASASGYETNLARLIDVLRAEFKIPELPFIIGQLGDFPEKPWDEYRLEVDAAHKRLASRVNRCEFVSALGLGHKGDEVHFSSEAYRELGHRYFEAYQRLVATEHTPRPRLASVSRIWDASPHNAFTDLVRFAGQWYCVFREGQGHVSPDGALHVIASRDAQTWHSVTRLTSENADLRDAKLSIMPDGRLMLLGAGAFHDKTSGNHQSWAWFSENGQDWSDPEAVGELDYWLWRVNWTGDVGLGVGYRTGEGERQARLYQHNSAGEFEVLVDNLLKDFEQPQGRPSESATVFLPDGTAFCLLRRDPESGSDATGLIGRSLPPYTDWNWKDLGVRIGGPDMLMLPDGRIIAAVRLYDGHVRTALCWLDPQQATLTEFLRLPSGGDTSYAGLEWYDDQLWVSYYSSHEALGNPFRSAIYLARVQL